MLDTCVLFKHTNNSSIISSHDSRNQQMENCRVRIPKWGKLFFPSSLFSKRTRASQWALIVRLINWQGQRQQGSNNETSKIGAEDRVTFRGRLFI